MTGYLFLSGPRDATDWRTTRPGTSAFFSMLKPVDPVHYLLDTEVLTLKMEKGINIYHHRRYNEWQKGELLGESGRREILSIGSLRNQDATPRTTSIKK